MPELTPSTREAARRIGITETALRKAEQTSRIAREPDGQWDIDKTRRRLVETADPVRSPLAGGGSAGNAGNGTPFARLKVAQLALKVEAQRLALDEPGGRAWQRWAESTACDAEGRLDLYGLQALVMRAVVESGECFVRFLPTPPSAVNPIGLRLQVLESDHLDTARQGMVEGAPTLQGIALGEAGEPIGYWLHRVHPGASWLLPDGAT